MTRDEAIAYWKQRSEHIHNWLEENKDADFVGEYVEAIDMAIEALSAEEEKENGTFVNRDNYTFNCNDSNRTLVDVVRCKDCKNNYNTCTNHGTNQPMCDFTDRMLKETDFCSRGERREPCD